jgi:protoporphyrinogen oxidase
MSQTAIIIGAGPAGLTAAYELLHKTDIKPIIIEKSGDNGGISKTINYKGNRMDIGGHRFFSKSDRVMEWWLNILSLEKTADDFTLKYQNKSKKVEAGKYAGNTTDPDKVMLVRKRVSRIYYLKKFFTYPITLSLDTISKLGFVKIFRIFLSYTKTKLFPRREEKTLEDFLINRFGKNLYNTFFKDYTEKVWGVACNKIPAEWGAQRIKELSIKKAVLHAIKKKFSSSKNKNLAQKNTSTTLIQHFLYPKYGPGQLWDEVARIVLEKGGEIHYNLDVSRFHTSDDKILAIDAIDTTTKQSRTFKGDYFFSTMPVKELIAAIDKGVPPDVAEIANGLQYRDFITVGLLLKKLRPVNKNGNNGLIEDNWIYIQEKDVKIGRLQLFNNWSPFMVKDPGTVWLGLEYFCNKEDNFWKMEDRDLIQFAIDELVKIEIIYKEDVLDHTVIRVEKTYPAYFGTYDQFPVVREYTDHFSNLFLIGRNGMHKYNNADHSMLTAMTAVDNIRSNTRSRENIWQINTEQDYQEAEE